MPGLSTVGIHKLSSTRNKLSNRPKSVGKNIGYTSPNGILNKFDS
jgi:hypothetical protein